MILEIVVNVINKIFFINLKIPFIRSITVYSAFRLILLMYISEGSGYTFRRPTTLNLF